MASKQSVFLISLGCAKNLVDSEHILGLLEAHNYPIVSSLEEAEVAIINTCAFVQSAVEETIDTIFEVVATKESGRPERVFVVGCFVQRYGYKLLMEIPEVDGWLGTGDICRVVDLLEQKPGERCPFFIGRPTYLPDHSLPRVQTTPFYSAYLKIAEGCSHRCSFCTIPAIRGPFRSRRLESLMIEAETLVSRGVKEINVIAQDTTMYGKDCEDGLCLEDLLENLLRIPGIEWIRTLYCHPQRITERLLELIDGVEAICPYLDLPLQHINEKILRAMGRPSNGESVWRLLERIRARTRRISLRTTLMIGFPGETEDMFEELYNLVKEAEFDHLGAFIFSREKGTRAARLGGVVKREKAQKRLDAIMNLQAEISTRKNRKMVGHVVPVLIEGVSPETDLLLQGRMVTMAPEVDGQVLINKGRSDVGVIVPVLIKEAHAYDLVGEIVP